jgi:hypothetical protein
MRREPQVPIAAMNTPKQGLPSNWSCSHTAQNSEHWRNQWHPMHRLHHQ